MKMNGWSFSRLIKFFEIFTFSHRAAVAARRWVERDAKRAAKRRRSLDRRAVKRFIFTRERGDFPVSEREREDFPHWKWLWRPLWKRYQFLSEQKKKNTHTISTIHKMPHYMRRNSKFFFAKNSELYRKKKFPIKWREMFSESMERENSMRK